MAEHHTSDAHPEFNTEDLIKPRRRLLDWRYMVPIWIGLILIVAIAYYSDWDVRVVGGGVVIVAILSNAITWLAAVIGMVPFVGPVVVKVLALPFIWLLNAVGYFVAALAIRRGYSKDVLTYRGLTIALLVGIVIGYVIGHFV